MGARRRFKVGTKCWAKCVRCDLRQMMDRFDLHTARGARCSACGGRLEVSSSQAERVAEAYARNGEMIARAEQQTRTPPTGEATP